jgi:hypothetical protein
LSFSFIWFHWSSHFFQCFVELVNTIKTWYGGSCCMWLFASHFSCPFLVLKMSQKTRTWMFWLRGCHTKAIWAKFVLHKDQMSIDMGFSHNGHTQKKYHIVKYYNSQNSTMDYVPSMFYTFNLEWSNSQPLSLA